MSTPTWWATPAAMASHLSRPVLDDGTLGEPEWQAARHLRLISLAVADVVAGRTKRLIVEAPPRHGKSELISRWAPLWMQAVRPRSKIMLASHVGEYAAEHASWVRDAITRYGEQLGGLSVSEDHGKAGSWRNSAGGGMIATGIGGGGRMTGRGADLLVIDDPVKDQADADSPTVRRSVWRWWRGTARTRLEPGAGVIVLMTRWHVDDLAGRLIEDGGERWRVLRLPAIADQLTDDGREPAADPLDREVGDALWPDRWPATELDEIRGDVGDYVFSAQFQGLPVPSEGGGILSRERQARAVTEYREAFPDGLDVEQHVRRIVVAVDPPGGRTEAGIVVMAELRDRLNGRARGVTLEDCTAAKRPKPEVWARAAIEAYYRWGANSIVAEANYGGDMVRSTIRAEDPLVPVELVTASKGKRVRAEPVAALFPREGRPGYLLRAEPMPRLVEEWSGWEPDVGMESPNRLDAEVWAATKLGLIRQPVRKARTDL